MMAVSSQMTDCTILTLDDLNGIDQNDMIAELEKYREASGKAADLIIPDRTLAIKKAWDMAEAGDWILVTGKGSEVYKDNYELPSKSDQETFALLIDQNTTIAT
jgi:UDP-N-acetylmuramoyl-L-alanyl-D-glutamate--2,6-diaminopimelate ligase